MSMRPPLLRLACASLVGAAALAGVAVAAPMPGFRPGESFIFNFSVGSLQAGRARLSVGAPKKTAAGARVALQGDAESSPWLAMVTRVHDVYRAVLDADGVPATRSVKMEEHGLRERTIDFVLDPHPAGTLLHLDITRPTEKRNELHQLAGTPLDLVGSLFFMRFQPLEPGDAFDFVFFDGPIFYRSHARVVGRETAVRAGASRPAVRVDVRAERIDWAFQEMPRGEKRHAVLLFSDDSDHIPLRVEGDTDFGTCTLELTGYQPGQPPVPQRRPAPTTQVVLRAR